MVSQCSQCSGGLALRLEAMVETLQDRRRRADQAAMLLLQQQQESKGAKSEVRVSGFFFIQDDLIRTEVTFGPEVLDQFWARGSGPEVFTVRVPEPHQ